MKQIPTKIIVLSALIFFGIALRTVWHIPNVVPVTAIALFVSSYFGLRNSIFVVITILLASDALIGFYSWPVMLSVYGCFIGSSIAGRIVRNNRSLKNIATVTIGSSLLFYIVTNWAVWQFGTMYEHSIAGIIDCYIMALPFFRNSLIGDIGYTVLLFGSYEAINHIIQRLYIYKTHFE